MIFRQAIDNSSPATVADVTSAQSKGTRQMIGMLRGAVLAAALAVSAISFGQQGTWTQLNTPCPESAETPVLLTDGSVLVKSFDNFQHYFKLTPTADFSYQAGKWTQVANSINGVLYGPTEVMRDGRVFIAGGEYLSNTSNHNTAQIYNPVTNTWTSCPDSLYSSIGDTGSASLADGKIICSNWSNSGTDIYDPATNTWTATSPMNQDTGDEESWQILPDGSVLNVYWSGQRFIPSLNQWNYTPALPATFVDDAGEIGALVYLYSGKALIFGGCVNTGATGLYTPPSTLLGTDDSWAIGPVIPNNYGCADCPACVEVNGKVLFIATPTVFGAPFFFEYDPTANTVNAINFPNTNGNPSYAFRMLQLPNGQVMVTGFGTQVWLYTPTSGPNNAWKANLTSLVQNQDSSYTLTGTQLNGLSNGAAYGDECNSYTNYPIVFLKNTTTGKYSFARTYNHSNMLLATGSTPVSTQFTMPAGLPAGQYQVSTSASGVTSANSITIGFGLQMPTTGMVPATPGGTVTYPMQAHDYFLPARTLTCSVSKGPSWVTWDGTTLTVSPPSNVLAGNYPLTLYAYDNGSPSASGTASLLIRVAPVSLQTAAFAAPSVLSGGTVQLTVTLSQPAPHLGTVVKLTPKSSALSCPASVTVPEGATTATVTVHAATTVKPLIGQINATYGTANIPATVRILPQPIF